MKVGMFTRAFSLPPRGDPQIEVFELARRLALDGVKVIIYSDKIDKFPKLDSETEFQDYQDNTWQIKMFSWKEMIFKRTLEKDIRKENLDLFIIFSLLTGNIFIKHLLGNHPIDIVSYLAKAAYGPHAWKTLRFSDFFKHFTSIFRPSLLSNCLPKFIVRSFLNDPRIKLFLVPSKRVKEKVLAKNDKPAYLLPPVIDFDRMDKVLNQCNRDRYRSKLGLRKDKVYVMSFSKSQILRGMDTLLEAAWKFKNNINISFIFFWLPGRDQNLIQKMLKKKYSRINNLYTEFRYVDNIFEWIVASDIIIFPFRFSWALPEYPLSILEAMALKKPVIVSRAGAVEEFLEDGYNALLLPVKGNVVNNLAERILTLANDKEKAMRLGQNAYTCVKELCDVDNNYKLFTNAILEATSEL
ncbi:glycosyltransferase family 4 protein [bacterium]|nr:glycosyltransferase family 4 protein [bacterium]